MSGAKKSIVINAPREKVFETITDFESYPEFLPEMKDVVVENESPKEIIASFTLNLVKEINYRLVLKLAKPSSVSWKLVDGDIMTENTGSWKLKKLSAKKTEATYSIEVGFGAFVPGFISNMLVSSSLPTMLNNFKKRIEES